MSNCIKQKFTVPTCFKKWYDTSTYEPATIKTLTVSTYTVLKELELKIPCMVALSSQPGGSSSSESDSGRKAEKTSKIKGILSRENKSGVEFFIQRV